LTGTVTVPVLRTGTILLTLTTLKIMSTEKGVTALCPRDEKDALVVPTKSTLTGTPTFPVLATRTVLLTLTILKIVSTEKGVPVLLVFETETTLS
jgi:hypothetical protein